MDYNKFQKAIELINSNINSRNSDLSKKELLLLKTVKLWEEVWELNNEILKSLWFARSQKLKDFDKNDLALEIADVIITAYWIAYELDIDMWKIMQAKIDKIFDRYNLN